MKRRKPKLASSKTCTGCMACVDSCSCSALKGIVGKDGHLYVEWEKGKCIFCGKCTKVCPVVSNYVYGERVGISKTYAGWCDDDDLRQKSASGGIFAALAFYVILSGGYVAGVIIDGCNVKHILTNDLNDLSKLQGSKYQQGDLSGIYREVLGLLKRGYQVLFSGTGCQVAALYSYLKINNYVGQLITVDLICGGFSSLLPLNALKRNVPIKEIISFRDKSHGWKSTGFCYSLKVINNDGVCCDLGDSNLVLKCFSSHFLNRNSCLNCRFAYPHRKADITIADFWGDKNYPSEHYKGLSVVILHNEERYALLKSARISLRLITWNNFLNCNPRMVVGQFRFYNLHPGRFLAPWLFKNMSYSDLCKIYGSSGRRGIIAIPFMIFSFLIRKISNVFFQRSLNENIKMLSK